jgi:cytochrome c556
MKRDARMKPKFRGEPALTAMVAVVLASGLAPGASGGDDLPIQKIMDQVHTRNRAIGKALRAPTAFEAAGRKGMALDAASLIRLGKETRRLTQPAQGRKKSQQEWTQSVDDFLGASEEFARIIADPRSARPEATRSYQTLQKTCINCHSAFREEAD